MKLAVCAAFLFATYLTSSELAAQDDWHVVTSHDGVVQAMLPGVPETKTDVRKTIAGKVKTDVKIFRTDNVQFTVTTTALSRMIRRFAKDEKIFDSARDSILSDVYGKEISYDPVTIDGIPGRKLEYEMVDFDEEQHKGYRGTALIFIHKNRTYVGNAIIKKEAGESDLIKFRESVRILKK